MWNEKQKKAFVRIQNEILSKMGLTNKEVAEMFTLGDMEAVFYLFEFQTSRWISEFGRGRHLGRVIIDKSIAYTVDLDDDDMVTHAKDAMLDDVDNAVKHNEVHQWMTVEEAPDAEEVDIPTFLLDDDEEE